MASGLGYGDKGTNRFWVGGTAALGRIPGRRYPADSRQPMGLGRLHVIADARLDDVETLRKALEQGIGSIDPATGQAELILLAYQCWGVECVRYLRGEFAFGVWDELSKTLFCVRDQFGIRPLYYSASDRVFSFSNAVSCLRRHPAVAAELNEQAIGDFLIFGSNYDLRTTTFKDIQRLPPAHYLVVTQDDIQVHAYWSPPTHVRIRYKSDGEYVEHFSEVARAAVRDRLSRTGKTGIWLSGGTDSGAVAAFAAEILGDERRAEGLRSYTYGYQRFVPDEEHQPARMVAEHLGIPNRYTAMDDCEPFGDGDDPTFRLSEPIDNPFVGTSFAQLESVARECSVILSGEGPDNLLFFQMWPYLWELRREKKWSQLARDLAKFLAIRRLPWRGVLQRAKSRFGRIKTAESLPAWIEPEFAKRTGLVNRLNEFDLLSLPQILHPSRPRGHASLLLPEWANMFEQSAPGFTGRPIGVSYPFLDLRVVEFLLAIPSFPWAYQKRIVREAMRGRVPNAIVMRKKTPLKGNPTLEKIRAKPDGLPGQEDFVGRIRQFVLPARLPDYATMTDEGIRPYCLRWWLNSADKDSWGRT